MSFQPIKFSSLVWDSLLLTVALRISNLQIFGLYWLSVILALFSVHLQPRTGRCCIMTVLRNIKTTYQQVGMSELVGATYQYVGLPKLSVWTSTSAPQTQWGIPDANDALRRRCSGSPSPAALRRSRIHPVPILSSFPAIFNCPTSFCVKPDFVEERMEVICLTSRSSLLPVGLCMEPAGQCPGSGAFFIILLQWKHTVLQLAGKREKEPEGAGIIKRMQWQLWQVLGRTGSTELN